MCQKFLSLCTLCFVFLSYPFLQATNGELIALTDDTFDDYISEGISIVDFYLAPCNDCYRFYSVFENVAHELGNEYNFYTLEIQDAPNITDLYDPIELPTVIIFINGKEFKRWSGFCYEQVLKERILNAFKFL